MPNGFSRSAKISWPTRDRDDIIESIQAALPVLRERLSVRRVVLFGSYAEGRATVASDAARGLLLRRRLRSPTQGVDVLVVYEGLSSEDAFAVVKNTLPVRGLEPHVYTLEEASARAELLARMTREGIVIYEED